MNNAAGGFVANGMCQSRADGHRCQLWAGCLVMFLCIAFFAVENKSKISKHFDNIFVDRCRCAEGLR